MNLPSNFVCTAEEYADKHLGDDPTFRQFTGDLMEDIQELIEKIIMFQIGYYMARRLNGGLGHIADQYLQQITIHLNEYRARMDRPFEANTFSQIDY